MEQNRERGESESDIRWRVNIGPYLYLRDLKSVVVFRHTVFKIRYAGRIPHPEFAGPANMPVTRIDTTMTHEAVPGPPEATL